jgi:hypothetical protein
MAKRLRRRTIAATLVAVIAVGAIGAGTAYATTPANDNYGGVEGVVTGPGGPAAGGVLGEQASGGNTLPFTGADLGLYATAGVGMIGAGVLLRRAARRSN